MAVDLGRKVIFGLHKPTQNLIEEEQKMLTNQQNNKIMKSTRLFSSRLGNQAFYLTSRVNSRLLRELRQPWLIIALCFVLLALPTHFYKRDNDGKAMILSKQWNAIFIYLNGFLRFVSQTIIVHQSIGKRTTTPFFLFSIWEKLWSFSRNVWPLTYMIKSKELSKKTTINKGRQKALFTERLLLQLTLDTWHLKWKISSNTKPFRN